MHNPPDHPLDQQVCQRSGCCLKDCTLKLNTSCYYGSCCKKCKVSIEGTLCREAVNECDLPEYCSGDSADCPADVYKMDGIPCGTDHHCYFGACLDLQHHCTVLFGQGKTRSSLTWGDGVLSFNLA
nr:PREDICTED: disintegrin and metalloproteinase domain-containing protein 26A-like [Anolis carolinensis]|eukprot:XP_008121636.1 PREDICTED: disintegrin and metalloproteinase domain-containing protein 26A-like [Anolis carolinensis]